MTWEPRPLPTVTPESEEYWKQASEGELALTHCNFCGLTFHYPRSFCPDCFSKDIKLQPASGFGHVYSFSVSERVEGWPEENLPIILSYVELDEGPRIMSNIVECSPEDIVVGMPVEAVFVETEVEKIAVPVFRPQ